VVVVSTDQQVDNIGGMARRLVAALKPG